MKLLRYSKKERCEGVEQDLKQAKEFIGKACDLGNQESCEVYRELNEAGN